MPFSRCNNSESTRRIQDLPPTRSRDSRCFVPPLFSTPFFSLFSLFFFLFFPEPRREIEITMARERANGSAVRFYPFEHLILAKMASVRALFRH